ncbi:farnesol dehydrogenase-like isoform X2 [Ceratina calcarata]|uniref:Farnesol dehydrogenase-like isoform X2 n=1 Tax=Ceratina calcarata TaxID=156304 RepID=A0AAJ7WG79_9HYME|nr:farnesol dehydrogenase-like isoform X2 [Ceratina calcarata]
MKRWEGKTAIVTGAGSGIGEAVALALIRHNVNVIGLDVGDFHVLRNETESNRLKLVKADVSSKKDLEDAFGFAEERGGVDILVNSAGVVDYKRIIDSDVETFQRLLNINVLGMSWCTKLAVESMRKRNVEGHVININSVLGHEIPWRPLSESDGSNGLNLYPACKHACVAMTHTVRRELATMDEPKIRITSISPGLVKTNIAKHASEVAKILEELPALLPEDVADAVIYALGTRPQVQVR